MSDEIEVRLRYPNLGAAAGDIITMDGPTGRAWCRRGLAEPVDGAVAHVHDDPHPLAGLIDPLSLL
jgi:hypothetical protein